HHLARPFQPVVGGLDADVDLVADTGQIFPRLRELSLPLPRGGPPLPAVEQLVTEVDAYRSEVPCEKGRVVLEAVAPERLHVRHVFVPGRTHGRLRLLDDRAGFGDLRVRFEGDPGAFFPLAALRRGDDGWIEAHHGCQR